MRIERLDDRTIIRLTDLELETLRAGACSVVDFTHKIGITREHENLSTESIVHEEYLIARFPLGTFEGGEADGVRLDSGDSSGEPAGPIWGCDRDND